MTRIGTLQSGGHYLFGRLASFDTPEQFFTLVNCLLQTVSTTGRHNVFPAQRSRRFKRRDVYPFFETTY